MINEREIRERLSNYLGRRESAEDLADWLSSQLSAIRFGDDDLFKLAAPIQNQLEVYFDHLINEDQLRNGLRNLDVAPHVNKGVIIFSFAEGPVVRPKPQVRAEAHSFVQSERLALV